MFFNFKIDLEINFLTSFDLCYLPKKVLSIFEIDQPSGFFVGPQEKFGDEGLFNLGEFITYKKEEMLKRILANTEKLMEGQI